MMSALVDQSIVNCFTWVLYQQGKLDRYLVGDQVPNKVLYTNSWLLVVLGSVLFGTALVFLGGARMSLG